MYRRRRFRKSRTFRRLRRRFRSRYGKRRNPGMGSYAKRFFKLRRVINIAVVANQTKVDFFNDNPSLYQDWVNVSELFQMYRVNGIKLTWIPAFNTNALATTVGSFTPMYMIHDTINTITGSLTENDALQFENMRVRPLNRMYSTYFKFSRRINATAPGTLSTDGYSTVSSPQATQQIVTLIPPTGTVTTGYTLGRFVSTLYLTAKVRR